MQGALNPLLSNIVPVFYTCGNLDSPIALRKGTWSCTNQLVAKYPSYDKLSQSHRAFT